MPRIAGVDVPDKKKIRYAIRYIFGIGKTAADQIVKDLALSETMRARDLSRGLTIAGPFV